VYWTGIDALGEHLEQQVRFVAKRVPAYERLLELLQARLEGGLANDLARIWGARPFHASYERPLLLQAALRFAALNDGAKHPLFAALVEPADADAVTDAALTQALDDERVWNALEKRIVQTNETSRALVWLWPAALIGRAHPGATLSLNDVGASAGLNLVGDRLAMPWVLPSGAALLPEPPDVRIVERRGFDASPLDAINDEDARWLAACVWPGQVHRIERLREALAAFTALSASGHAPVIERKSAASAASELGVSGDFSIAYQSLVLDYLEPAEKDSYETRMRAWLESRPGRNLWLQLEVPDVNATAERGATLTCSCFARGSHVDWVLALCHPHPDVILVDESRVQELSALLAG
jgi:hypothetical protein